MENHGAVIWRSWLDYDRQIIGYADFDRLSRWCLKEIELSLFASLSRLLGNLYLPHSFASVAARTFSVQASPLRIRQRGWKRVCNGNRLLHRFCIPRERVLDYVNATQTVLVPFRAKAEAKANEVSRQADWLHSSVSCCSCHGYFGVSYWKSLTALWFYSISFH